MYALIDVHYDWYRFERLIAVSKDKVKLQELAKKENSNYEVSEYDKKNDPYEGNEGTHYWITKIKLL